LNEDAKKIWDEIEEGKWSEKDLKNLTGLNIGKIKEAKKWMKQHDLIQSYRGRGGYISRKEGAEFPQEENTMTAVEKAAAAREEKRIIKAEAQRRREIAQLVLDYAATLPETEGADKIDLDYITQDNYYCHIWVWRGKKAKGYKVYVEDAEYYMKDN
jgi:DNA-binding transcriptional regulator YhcF (GntR family)